ncbi:hypothetical protein ABFY60_02855 [Lysinibacillus pakistanensis]|uniref:hypothetical protein n=1 Tax=Lysinibacillus pakistanensis TaxID=759811 RepID=UPI003D2AE412
MKKIIFTHWNSDDLPKDERYVIYGAGEIGEFVLLELLKRDISIVAVVDKNVKKLLNFDVIKPELIFNLTFDKIIVCSNIWQKEIVEFLITNFVKEEKIVLPMGNDIITYKEIAKMLKNG